MQIFTVNITRVVWPRVTIPLDLRHFCQHMPLLNPLLLLKLAKKYLFFGEYFCPTYFPMSKSSIKTKTVLTMTDMTESTELLAFKRQKDGYKVTVKISLCICVVLSWDELKVRQNLLDSDYGIYMVRLLVATVNWHKSLQFVKKSNITLLPCLFVMLSAVSIITLSLGITFWQEPRFCVVFSPPPFISWASHAIINTDTNEYLPCIKTFFYYYFELRILEYVLFSVTNRCFSGSTGGQIKFFVFRCWRGGKAIGKGWGCLCCTS